MTPTTKKIIEGDKLKSCNLYKW